MIWCICKLFFFLWRRFIYMYIDIVSYFCCFVLYYCIVYVIFYYIVCFILLKNLWLGFYNWLYMIFCWVLLLGLEYVWFDLNFILEVLCCKDVICICVLNKWRYWLYSLEGLYFLLVGGIGVGVYLERCK